MMYPETWLGSQFLRVQRYLTLKKVQIFPRCIASMKPEIRQVNEKDVSAIQNLVRASYKRNLAEELEDQKKGLTSIFVAWMGPIPCGYSFVCWQGPRDPSVRRELPDVPEFYCLTVTEPFRCKGVGTALIHYIEEAAQKRGISKMGLGVAYTNPRAKALYLRLGYEEAIEKYEDRYPCLDKNGHPREATDQCRFMVKNLEA